ncbi:MAG: hypothetical protein ACRDVW_02760, partial [Acidimicrobiales bacterium]
ARTRVTVSRTRAPGQRDDDSGLRAGTTKHLDALTHVLGAAHRLGSGHRDDLDAVEARFQLGTDDVAYAPATWDEIGGHGAPRLSRARRPPGPRTVRSPTGQLDI